MSPSLHEAQRKSGRPTLVQYVLLVRNRSKFLESSSRKFFYVSLFIEKREPESLFPERLFEQRFCIIIVSEVPFSEKCSSENDISEVFSWKFQSVLACLLLSFHVLRPTRCGSFLLCKFLPEVFPSRSKLMKRFFRENTSETVLSEEHSSFCILPVINFSEVSSEKDSSRNLFPQRTTTYSIIGRLNYA